MPRTLLTRTAALAVALTLGAQPVSAADAGAAPELRKRAEPVQYVERGRIGPDDTLIRQPSLAQPRSLFRPFDFQPGPHYQPPAVIYEPPPVTYRPPDVRTRAGCLPRTRAWYASCAARYRSFDPNRGTYRTYSGQERVCRCP